MPSSDERIEPFDERVSTEPQRRALDAMSADLVRKLHDMVAEQEARARDFAEHQHSLSSLPQLQPFLPPQPTPPPQQESTSQQPQPKSKRIVSNPPRFPNIPRQKKDSRPSYAPLPHEHWEDAETSPRETEQKKEGGIGAGTIVFIIFAIIVILRNCG